MDDAILREKSGIYMYSVKLFIHTVVLGMVVCGFDR